MAEPKSSTFSAEIWLLSKADAVTVEEAAKPLRSLLTSTCRSYTTSTNCFFCVNTIRLPSGVIAAGVYQRVNPTGSFTFHSCHNSRFPVSRSSRSILNPVALAVCVYTYLGSVVHAIRKSSFIASGIAFGVLSPNVSSAGFPP
jgi:hypothetical protein